MTMHYAYHPELGKCVVETSEYEKLLTEGWYDTPTKFPDKSEGLAATPTTESGVKPRPRKKKEA